METFQKRAPPHSQGVNQKDRRGEGEFSWIFGNHQPPSHLETVFGSCMKELAGTYVFVNAQRRGETVVDYSVEAV